MVATLVRLKLTLLLAGLRQSAWRVVGLVLGLVWGSGVLVLGVVGLVAARGLSVEYAGAVVVLGGALLVLGWTILPLLVFGVDETLDPGRFALLPLTARQLAPGLLAAGALGVPGLVTVVLSATTLVTWSRGPLVVAAALGGAVLGVLTCLLAGRVLTTAFAQALASRRFKDLSAVVLITTMASLGIGLNAGMAVLVRTVDDLGRLAERARVVVGWTPLGWAWSAPAHAAQADPGLTLAKLALAAVLVVALALGWVRMLDRSLTAPLVAGSGGHAASSRSSLLDRWLPHTPVGGVALRSLRYLRRDPRYAASMVGVLIAPAAMVLAGGAAEETRGLLVWAPVMVAWLVGVAASQDTSYDGSALWTHVSAGLTGREDRAGRALALLTWAAPLLLTLVVGGAAVAGAWGSLPGALGLGSATLLCGVSVSAWVSAVWQGPVPPPGANPFGKGSGGSIESFVAVFLAMILIAVLSVPILALVIGSVWVPWLGWVALVTGPAYGLLALRQGITMGGRHLDARWPEVLARVAIPVG